MSLLLLVGMASAVDLHVVAEAAALDGVVWIGPDLLVGSPREKGLPAWRPVSAPGELGTIGDLTGYEPIGETCDRKGDWSLSEAGPEGRRAVLAAEADLDGDGTPERAVLHAGPNQEGLLPYADLAVTVDGQSVALEQTAFACELRPWVVDGRELLMIVWRSAGGSGFTQGVTLIGG